MAHDGVPFGRLRGLRLDAPADPISCSQAFFRVGERRQGPYR